jgi:hypothetical protein
VWGAPGKDTATQDTFFAELGDQRADQIEAVSMDMGAAFNKSVRENAPQAVICIDPFHAVQLVTDALDMVRRAAWNELRQLPDQDAAKRFKGARWALLKRPENPPANSLRRCAGYGTAQVSFGARTPSRRHSARSLLATWTPPVSCNYWTGGARKPPARAWTPSSRSPRPSENFVRASWPPFDSA